MRDGPSDPADVVADVLEGYARRGIFRGFSRGPTRGARTHYRVTWHHDRPFELVLDEKRFSLRFPLLLEGVPPGKKLYTPLAAFVRSRHAPERPEHRRIDPSRARIKSYRRAGNVSLTLTVENGDWEYGTRKLVHLAQEIFLDFLREGPGFEYLVTSLDLDPDSI